MGYLDGSDGMVDVKCFVCGETISSGVYMGFRTAKCIKCQTGNEIVEESIPLELRVTPEEGNIIQEAVQEVVETVKRVIQKTKTKVEKKVEKWKQPPAQQQTSLPSSKIHLKKKM